MLRHELTPYVRQKTIPCGIARQIEPSSTLPGSARVRARIEHRARRYQLQSPTFLAIAGISLMSMAEVASGQKSGVSELSFDWTAPAACPERGDVLVRIANRLQLPERGGPQWHVEARVLTKHSQYELELSVRRDGSEPRLRSLRASDCGALADATAVLVALALEPQPYAATAPDGAVPDANGTAVEGTADVRARSPEPEEARAPDALERKAAETPKTPPVGAAAEAVQPAAEGGGTQSWPLRVGLGASLRLNFGMLPQSPGLGAVAQIQLRLWRLRAAAGLSVFPRAESTSATYPAARMRTHALLGEGLLGVAVVERPLSLVPYAVFEYGSVTADTRRIAAPDARDIRWTAVGVGAQIGYRLIGGFEFCLDVTGLTPLSRPRWWVRTDQGDLTLFEAAPVAVSISAGLVYVFE
jgi:hypothetical protein